MSKRARRRRHIRELKELRRQLQRYPKAADKVLAAMKEFNTWYTDASTRLTTAMNKFGPVLLDQRTLIDPRKV